MTELPELPPPPSFWPSPRPGGLEQAVAEGRRRRGRFLAGTGAGGALSAVLLVGLLSSSPTGREDSLRVASPAPQPSATATALAIDLPSAAPLPQTRSGGQGPAASSARPRPVATGPGAGPAEAPRQAAPAPVSSPLPVAQRPAYREQTDEDAEGAAFCRPGELASGACAYGGGDNGPVVRRGAPVTANVGGYCAGRQNGGDRVYVFDSGQETELVVRQGGREVFRFSSTVRYVDGPHERRLRPGRCIEWRQRWNGVTTGGDPVPAGTYQVELTRTTSRERSEFDGRSQEHPGTTDAHTFEVTLVD